jgi:hypothetical protein
LGTNAHLALEREDRTVSNALSVVNTALRASHLPEATRDEVVHTHAITISRAFDLRFPGRRSTTRVLIPFFDLLNHSPDIDISYDFEQVASSNSLRFKVSTNSSIEMNSEAFVNYGSINSSSSGFFLQYAMSIPPTSHDHFQIMASIAPDELYDLKQEALRSAGIDVNVPDASLSIALDGRVPPRLLRCIAVLTSNKTHAERLNDIARGHFLPNFLEFAALQSLSQGIAGVLSGFPSDLDSAGRVNPVRLALAQHQIQLETSILKRSVPLCYYVYVVSGRNFMALNRFNLILNCQI